MMPYPLNHSPDARSSGDTPRLGVVLSAGGLRGAAHLGVLRRLIHAGLPIEVVVGASAGAVIGAYYAAVGLSIDEIIGDAPRFRSRHFLFHGLSRRSPAAIGRMLLPYCGVIPRRLSQLDAARFDTLHYGVTRFGVVCHDIDAGRPVYFSTHADHGARLPQVVRASAAVPGMFPPAVMNVGGRSLRLVDGGMSDAIPCDFARQTHLGATHLVVSDCRRLAGPIPLDERMIYVRPELEGLGSLWRGRVTLDHAVRAGELAVTDAMLNRIREWTMAAVAV